MAKRHNLKCPKCGSKLWFSQSKKVYKCVDPSCSRYNGSSKAEEVAKSAEKEAESIKNPSFQQE